MMPVRQGYLQRCLAQAFPVHVRDAMDLLHRRVCELNRSNGNNLNLSILKLVGELDHDGDGMALNVGA